MPGGRLTHDERVRIGAGLGAGLSYSRIAADLGRPVSTVSREVERNGGTDGYHADRAQEATGRRARRGKATAGSAGTGPADPAGTGGPADDGHVDPVLYTAAPGADSAVVREFGERFTPVLMAAGLPRMAARLLACLYATDSGSLTSAELVRFLQVSPASVSKAVGHLEEQGLIRRERHPHGRAELYVIDNDVWLQAIVASIQANARIAAVALDGARLLGAATPAGVRLSLMSTFLDRIGRDLARGAERWRHVVAGPPARDDPSAGGR
ncbi:MarR family transcriptional regulator [Embleya sp. NPDC059237]|uniref:GbsR/MarR family transcriptional regulator n=1 Tax=Embleya sp. NPDC059237 TaxID=3346784 RepID=UPI00368C78BE